MKTYEQQIANGLNAGWAINVMQSNECQRVL